MSRWRVCEEGCERSGVNSSGEGLGCEWLGCEWTRKVTRKALRGTRREVTCKVRASPRKVTCILARRRANGSMRDCVEISRVSRAASDAAWDRSSDAERRWGSNMRFHGGAGLPAGEAQRSGAGGWEWTLPETFSWYTPELGGCF